MTSPMQQSLALLRDQGFTCHIVEHWNPFCKRRVDCLGFGDILAVKANHPVMLVQTTTAAHFNARMAKIGQEPKAGIWLSAGNTAIAVHGWHKIGKRGERKVWAVRTENWRPR